MSFSRTLPKLTMFAVIALVSIAAAGAANADAAEKILEGAGQKLRPALSAIEGSKGR